MFIHLSQKKNNLTEKEFVLKWNSKLADEGFKVFPDDFIDLSDTSFEKKNLELPNKTLVLGSEFFGEYEVNTIDGKSIYRAPYFEEAKYIIYTCRMKPSNILIPQDPKVLKKSVKDYEMYLDGIIKKINDDYKKSFPESKNVHQMVNDIFRVNNIVRY